MLLRRWAVLLAFIVAIAPPTDGSRDKNAAGDDTIRQSLVLSASQPFDAGLKTLKRHLKNGYFRWGLQQGQTLFHMAAHVGNIEVLKTLHSRDDLKSMLDLSDNDGHSPLFIACVAGQSEAVQTLLQLGADPSTVSAFSPAVAHVSHKLLD